MRTESAEQLEGVLIAVLMNRLEVDEITIDLNEVEQAAENIGSSDIELHYEINRAKNTCTFYLRPVFESDTQLFRGTQ